MRLITFAAEDGPRLGVLGEAGAVLDLRSAGFAGADTMQALIEGGPAELTGLREWLDGAQIAPAHWLAENDVTLLAPIPQIRKNLYCVGRNYKLHIEESARAKGIPTAFPAVPELFTKPATAVIGYDAGIKRYSALTQKLDYEVELAIVIGRTIRDATCENALDAIFGYTIVNDISARDVQMAHGQWFKGKALDTFCPVGPCIVTSDEFGAPAGHRITLRVNGETRQDSTTSDMLFDVAEIVVSLSAGQTLHAGDIIATGTPSGVAFGMAEPAYLEVGDIVEAEISGIGILRNPIIP
jgi:2-keto-4-pentenoate hydratase/2-oxohepta-3-ene-1,7-dioic acid hydratase in catechol pathway